MLDQFTGRAVGDHAYIECTLATDLSTFEGEEVPTHKAVDIKLPNGKLLRLPYAWLREVAEVFPLDSPAEVLGEMLDATEDGVDQGLPTPEQYAAMAETNDAAPPRKAVVKRAPGK